MLSHHTTPAQLRFFPIFIALALSLFAGVGCKSTRSSSEKVDEGSPFKLVPSKEDFLNFQNKESDIQSAVKGTKEFKSSNITAKKFKTDDFLGLKSARKDTKKRHRYEDLTTRQEAKLSWMGKMKARTKQSWVGKKVARVKNFGGADKTAPEQQERFRPFTYEDALRSRESDKKIHPKLINPGGINMPRAKAADAYTVDEVRELLHGTN